MRICRAGNIAIPGVCRVVWLVQFKWDGAALERMYRSGSSSCAAGFCGVLSADLQVCNSDI